MGRKDVACVSSLILCFQENSYAEKSNQESRQEGRKENRKESREEGCQESRQESRKESHEEGCQKSSQEVRQETLLRDSLSLLSPTPRCHRWREVKKTPVTPVRWCSGCFF